MKDGTILDKTAKEVAELANDVEDILLIKQMSDKRIIINEADSVYICIILDVIICLLSISLKGLFTF